MTVLCGEISEREALLQKIDYLEKKLESLSRAVLNDQTSHDQAKADKSKERLADLILKAFHEWAEDDIR